MRENAWYDDLYQTVQTEVSEQLDSGTLSQVAQSLINQVLPSLINSLKDVVPNKTELEEIAKDISNKVVLTVKNKVLPRLYNRSSTPLKLSGISLSEEKISKMYYSIIDKVPQNYTINVQGRNITVNFRRIVRDSFTYTIFKNYVENVLIPVSNQFVEDLEPAKSRVINASGLALTSSFILGAISMYGFIKLVDKARG